MGANGSKARYLKFTNEEIYIVLLPLSASIVRAFSFPAPIQNQPPLQQATYPLRQHRSYLP